MGEVQMPAGELPDPGVLAGARVVVGVTGGIAAYKAIELVRRLVAAGAVVAPVLTENSLRFVGAQTFDALASEPARTALFDADDPIPHTQLGRTADLVVVAPATARIIGEYAHGVARDLLGATLLATEAPVVVCPAMHHEMWHHPAVVENVAVLERRGVIVVGPERGVLAGGDEGDGRLASTDDIAAACIAALSPQDLSGRRVLVTAGGTREAIDPVRYLSNRSSGKQGYALAAAARRRGAVVTLVSASRRPAPPGVALVRVDSAEELQTAVMAGADADVVLMAAAVADFRPEAAAATKLKRADGVPEIRLVRTPDVLAGLVAARRAGQVIVGFAAETDDVVRRGAEKLAAKGVDLLVVNDVSRADAGFDADTNAVWLLDTEGQCAEVPLAAKSTIADAVLDRVVALLDAK